MVDDTSSNIKFLDQPHNIQKHCLLKDFLFSKMWGDDLLDKVANNFNKLSTKFCKIHLVDSCVIINGHNIVKEA